MFTVVIDGNTIYDPNLVSLGHVILSPKLNVGLNKSGEFSFILPPTNPYYDDITQISSEVFVLNNNSFDDVLFFGRVLNVSIDFDKKKSVYCEGILSYLVDSVLRPYSFEGSPNELFEYYVGRHNAAIDPDNTLGKRISIGIVNVDSSTQVEEYSESYVSTLDELQDKLLGKYGGYVVARWDSTNNKPVLDYISDIARSNSQLIQYSRNLLDLVEDQSAEDIYTVAIPLGAQLYDEDTGEYLGRVSIKDYPNEGDPDYIEAEQEFLDRFGRIEKIYEFDYITEQSDLYTIGEYLVSYSAYIPSKLSIKAIDLNLVDKTFTQIKVGDLMSVVSPPHDVDRQLLCTSIQYDLFEPGNTVYDFEVETTYVEGDSLSKRQNNTENRIRKMYGQSLNMVENSMAIAEEHIAEARAESSAQIANGLAGYVYKTHNELFIMDTDDIRTATKVWRWNSGGLGYWTGTAGHALDAGAQYTIAITADGTITADVLRGSLVDTIVFNAVLGTIGGWNLSSNGIWKEVEDELDSTKVYKVTLYPPSTSSPETAKVLSFEKSDDSGATFSPTFYIQGDGTMISVASGYTVPRLRVISGSYYSEMAPYEIKAALSSSGNQSRLYPGNVDGLMQLATDAALFGLNASSGLTFSLRDPNNVVTNRATYPGAGWRTYTLGPNTWRYLTNGYTAMAICKRTVSNVSVTNTWNNIYCGTTGGPNFSSISYPIMTGDFYVSDGNGNSTNYFKFAGEPVCIAQVVAPRGYNDGWLVTNTDYGPSSPDLYSPAYDLARGSATTSPISTITVNYFVFGEIEGYFIQS